MLLKSSKQPKKAENDISSILLNFDRWVPLLHLSISFLRRARRVTLRPELRAQSTQGIKFLLRVVFGAFIVGSQICKSEACFSILDTALTVFSRLKAKEESV